MNKSIEQTRALTQAALSNLFDNLQAANLQPDSCVTNVSIGVYQNEKAGPHAHARCVVKQIFRGYSDGHTDGQRNAASRAAYLGQDS